MDSHFAQRLLTHARSKSNNPALIYYDGTTKSSITYSTLSRIIFESEKNTDDYSLELILGHQNPQQHLRFLKRLIRGQLSAFVSPMTPKQDPYVYENERMLLETQLFKTPETSAHSLVGEMGGLLQFTSGTTGVRKGMFITMDRLEAHLLQLEGILGLNEKDIICSWLPVYHDMGLISSFLLPLFSGVTVVLIDPILWSYRPMLFLEATKTFQCTIAWMPNFAFDHTVRSHDLVSHLDVELSSLRLLINCSEPCKLNTFRTFFNRFERHGLAEHALQCSYAMAENIFAISLSRYKSPSEWLAINGILSSGHTIDGTEVFLERLESDSAEKVEAGQLVVTGNHLINNYYPTTSDKFRFTDNGVLFHTRDNGFIDDKSNIFVFGRIDDTLIIRGKKLLAWEIEDEFAIQSGSKRGRVLAFADSRSNYVCVAFEGEISNADIKKIRNSLSEKFQVNISRFYPLNKGVLIKTSSGKIARAKSIQKLKMLKVLDQD